MLILFNSFLELSFCSSIFFHHLVQQVCPCIWQFEIPMHCFGTRDTLKKLICLSILKAFFLLLCHFHMNLKILTWIWKYKTHYLIINLLLEGFYHTLQFLPWEEIEVTMILLGAKRLCMRNTNGIRSQRGWSKQPWEWAAGRNMVFFKLRSWTPYPSLVCKNLHMVCQGGCFSVFVHFESIIWHVIFAGN